MKKLTLFFVAYGCSVLVQAQMDTTRIKLPKAEILIIEREELEDEVEVNASALDSLAPDADEDHHKTNYEAHWAGIDLGFTSLLNSNNQHQFPNHPFLKNDPASSLQWNFNLMEYKLGLFREYVGITTGLGIGLNQISFQSGEQLTFKNDTLQVTYDTITSYSKNKLRAAYLTVPVLLELCSAESNDNQFYLSAGIVGGVRIGSSVKRVGDIDGKGFKQKLKGSYGLNPYRLDAHVRAGFGDVGLHASYSLLTLFQSDVSEPCYPFSFGVSLNF